MQVILNTIYKEISVKNDQEYDLVKSVGDCVFKSLLANIKEPQSLILKVKGIGQFYLRQAKLIDYIESKRDFYLNPENIYRIKTIGYDAEEFAMRQRRFENLITRLEDYKIYLEKKREIREIRNQTQPLIEKTEEDDS